MYRISKLGLPLTALLLMLAVAMTLVIAACGGDDEEEPAATAAPAPTAAPTAAPAPTMAPAPTAMPTTAAPPAEPEPVSPRLILAVPPPSQEVGVIHLANNLTNSFLVHYDHLIASDPQTAAYGPQIATEWDTSPNGKTWTFKLRDDVPFYGKDGNPSEYHLTADDVVFSFNLLIGVGTEKAINPANWEGYAGREDAHIANGDYEVIFDMHVVQLDLLTFMSDEVESGISSKGHWDAVGGEDGYNDNPIGAGPFTLQELNQGVNYLYERVEDHWRHTPYFHELEMKMIPESSTRLASLLTEESHLAVVPRDIHDQATAAGMEIYRASIPGGHFNMRLPWYKPQNYVKPDGSKAYSAGPEGPRRATTPTTR